MKATATWRELLAEITRDPQERERIARELKVHPVTINRWVNKESIPRLDNLRHLLDAVPEQRKRFHGLLIHEFPDIALYKEADEPFYEVTSDFYASVFRTYVTLPASMCFWPISRLVLQYLLEQLDAELQHVAILLLQCHPSCGRTIRSLRSVMGVGTPPWSGNLEVQTILLGAESFAGQVLLSRHPDLIVNTEEYAGSLPRSEYALSRLQSSTMNNEMENSHSPDFQIQQVGSEMATPIVCIDKSAGVLYACSTHPGAFRLPHLQLLRECAILATLAFAVEDFYAQSDIVLHMMPPPWMQIPLLQQAPHRILRLMGETVANSSPLDRTSAERIVWQQIEEELILLPSRSQLKEAGKT